MAKCKECIHFPICKPHTDPNESYSEVGGCSVFKRKDLVEVVRCKDCIGKAHWYKNDYGCTICGLSGLFVVEDRDFCSYGERREGE